MTIVTSVYFTRYDKICEILVVANWVQVKK